MRPALALATVATIGALAYVGIARAASSSSSVLGSLLAFAGGGLTRQEADLLTYDKNVQAFLSAIRHAEGTAGPDGYRMLFGGRLFDNFADHPRITITLPAGSGMISSTAAGAYQILERTWDDVQAHLELPDFGPASQDAAAVYLIDRRGALELVKAGDFAAAIQKVAKEWASLPGSPYGQPTRSLAELAAVYTNAGGSIA